MASDLIERARAKAIELLKRNHAKAGWLMKDLADALTARAAEIGDLEKEGRRRDDECAKAEARADALAARVAEMEEVLAWYGENARLCRIIHSGGDPGRQALSNDGGKRAEAALHPKAPAPAGEGGAS